MGVITLLEGKDQEFLGEKNGVAPTLEMEEELTKTTSEEGKAVSVGRVRDVFSLICYLLSSAISLSSYNVYSLTRRLLLVEVPLMENALYRTSGF